MTSTASIKTISNSSDIVWELVCAYEDGETGAEFRAALKTLSDADRRIFTDEVNDIHVRWACKAVRAAPTHSVAARNAARAHKDGAHAAEECILRQQGY